jgi:hypothetical protein
MTSLPNSISLYFAATSDTTRECFDKCFAANAIVHDEGKHHHGIDEIKAWHIEASGPDPAVARVISMREEDGKVIVPAEITGAFKGSPVILDFAFTLKSGLIAELEIH